MADVSLRSVITGPSAQFQHIHPPRFGMIGGDSSTSSTIFSRRGWFTGNPYCNICYYDLHKEKHRKIFCRFSLNTAVSGTPRRRCCGTSPMPSPWLLTMGRRQATLQFMEMLLAHPVEFRKVSHQFFWVVLQRLATEPAECATWMSWRPLFRHPIVRGVISVQKMATVEW